MSIVRQTNQENQSGKNILNDIEIIKKRIVDNLFENVKNGIVSAMSTELHGKGHWFKCSKGHYYVIGECGGATETAKCPECNEVIGGTGHQLVESSQVASEMDGADNSAWTLATMRHNALMRQMQ